MVSSLSLATTNVVVGRNQELFATFDDKKPFERKSMKKRKQSKMKRININDNDCKYHPWRYGSQVEEREGSSSSILTGTIIMHDLLLEPTLKRQQRKKKRKQHAMQQKRAKLREEKKMMMNGTIASRKKVKSSQKQNVSVLSHNTRLKKKVLMLQNKNINSSNTSTISHISILDPVTASSTDSRRVSSSSSSLLSSTVPRACALLQSYNTPSKTEEDTSASLNNYCSSSQLRSRLRSSRRRR
jgi:hypothetical protein